MKSSAPSKYAGTPKRPRPASTGSRKRTPRLPPRSRLAQGHPQPVLDREGIEVAREIDLKAVDTVLKLMDRRAKLNGLDMPVKAELSGAALGGADRRS